MARHGSESEGAKELQVASSLRGHLLKSIFICKTFDPNCPRTNIERSLEYLDLFLQGELQDKITDMILCSAFIGYVNRECKASINYASILTLLLTFRKELREPISLIPQLWNEAMEARKRPEEE